MTSWALSHQIRKSLVVVVTRRVELDPETPVTRAPSGNWGSQPAARRSPWASTREGHLDPSSPPAYPLSPSSLIVYQLPQLGQRPKPVLDSLSLGRPNSTLLESIGRPPSFPPSLKDISVSPCPKMNSAGQQEKRSVVMQYRSNPLRQQTSSFQWIFWERKVYANLPLSEEKKSNILLKGRRQFLKKRSTFTKT